MWKPGDVVPEHRKRATAIWGALLLTIAGYTAWQIVALHRKFDHPSTNFSVSDDLYAFPPLEICFWGGKGCDESLDESTCVEHSLASVYDPCDEEDESIEFPSQYGNCLAFSLQDLDMKGFEDGCDYFKKPSMTITMAWYTSRDPLNEENYRELVGVFMGNESTPEYLTIPYSRVVYSPDSGGTVSQTRVETDLTIGKTTRNYLSGESVISYPILTYSTGDYVEQIPSDDSSGADDDTSSYAIGYLHLTLTQGAYSLTELSDINPLDIGTLLGNIGGFWELLLLTWGLCFIASRREAPTQRGRDFTQPIQKGKEIIVSRKRRSTTQTVDPSSEGEGSEQPYWIASRSGRRDAPSGSIRAIPSVGARPQTNRTASFFRRPVRQDYPVRPASNYTVPSVAGESSVESGARGATTTQQSWPPNYADCT